jgi:hypothetical protein
MKKKIIKLIALITLCATMLLCFSACGGQEIAADDDGKWGKNVTWEFKQATQTLTIEGTGDMENVTLKDVTQTKTDWIAIRNSVKKVVVGSGITGIGSYTFYGMTALEEVSLSSDLTKIGKCAFAFCASLKEVKFPAALAEIGDSAFEGCYSLSEAKLPVTTTVIGERAFAYCRNLTTLLVPGEISTLKRWTFKECEKLSTVALNKSVKSLAGFDALYKDAFEDSAKTKSSDAKYVDYTGETAISVWRYIDGAVYEKDNGAAYKTDKKAFGDKYSYNAPAIDGYVLDTAKSKETYSGTVIDLGETEDIIFHYVKKADAQKPAGNTDADKNDTTNNNGADKGSDGMSTGTVIALCIFGVVIVGVIVGAVIVIRSDKKGNKSTTVRKNDKKK